MAMQSARTTEFFDFWYDDDKTRDPSGFAHGRADALSATCDGDFHTLMQWFHVTIDDFGAKNLIRVNVTDDPKLTGGALGSNQGFKANGATAIEVTLYGQPDQTVADDFVRSVWVHEASEVLMSYRAQTVYANTAGPKPWDASTSDGEGLADTLQGLFYPSGYYGTNQGFRGRPWWATRPDWVSTNDTNNGQANPLSTGCAITFLYYLYHQLDIPFDQIIANGGVNLEQTYKALTGETGGYQAMISLLNRHITPPAAPPNDDPFPLDWTRATVQVSASQAPPAGSLPRLPIANGTVTVRPFFLCPPAQYRYRTYVTHNALRFVAAVTGFGTPTCTWSLNGTPVEGIGTLTVTTGFAPDDPAQPDGVAPVPTDVDVDYRDLGDTTTAAGHQFTLELRSAKQGHIGLDVEASVIENIPATVNRPGLPPRRGAGHAVLDTVETIYLDPFATDKQKCITQFEKYGTFHVLKGALAGHDPVTLDGLRRASALQSELTQLAQDHPDVAKAVSQHLAQRTGYAPVVAASNLAPPAATGPTMLPT